MKWTDLVNKEIAILIKNKEELITKLDKIRNDDNMDIFGRKVELMSEIKAIDMAIFRFHILLDKANEINE